MFPALPGTPRLAGLPHFLEHSMVLLQKKQCSTPLLSWFTKRDASALLGTLSTKVPPHFLERIEHRCVLVPTNPRKIY